MFKDSLAIDKFLGQESGGGNHGKTSVLEFLGLHLEELSWVRGLQAKRIESKVSWDVVITQESWLVNRDVLGLDPANLSTIKFGVGDTDTQDQPEGGVDLGQVGDGRSSDLAVEDESLGLDGFTNEEADAGKHGNTSVGKLSLTVSLEGSFVSLGGETKRVEEASWLDGSRDGVDRESWNNRGSNLGGSLAEEGGDRGGKEGKGGGGLHFVY